MFMNMFDNTYSGLETAAVGTGCEAVGSAS